MTKEQVKKASEILEEIEDYSRFKDKLKDRENGRIAHFEMHQHYGDDVRPIEFHHKYNDRFIPVVEQIIKELNEELEKI